MFRRIRREFFGMKTRERLPRLPYQLANDYDRREVDENTARVFARVGARSPEGVKLALKKWKVQDVDELIALLPHQNRRANWRRRFASWYTRITGQTPYEPVVKPLMRRLRMRGMLAEQRTRVWKPRRTPRLWK